ncbi:hypothetical protein THAOC_12759 [Thalassiosira oceanica]|uniref:Uncharacterized protein n=1 Tax=Thalassiosira oceanica TaxID=159749 RepID=K0SLY1_THAOC|nr:hypothetical protein THAOC_12759 [Thalassiosira oceanica]|eukprot:EJK66330.1 hypothetical protein THAOC_12759 [Thalassiosira oceanica]
MVVDVAVRRLWIAVDGYRHRTSRWMAVAWKIAPRSGSRAVGWPTYGRFCTCSQAILGYIVGGRPGVASLSVLDRRRRISSPGRSRDGSCLEDRALARARGRHIDVDPWGQNICDLWCVERF